MVAIPAAKMLIGAADGEGDNAPPHDVEIAAFEIDVHEVTAGEFAACVTAGGCGFPPGTVWWQGITPKDEWSWSRFCNFGRPERGDHPMNCLGWELAHTYCKWKKKRLPTEEEWEYAARGTDGRMYPWGNQPPAPNLLNACGGECKTMLELQKPGMFDGDDGFGATSPGGKFPDGRSPFGIEDMAGNVWEWTDSRFCPYGQSDCTDDLRVSRGGGWRITQEPKVRATFRLGSLPAGRDSALGFRCAR